ncbi:MAG TPA: helix-turn-helix domain-containing protein [Acidimicrobiales bacterium]|jgi:AcrR family transcriptional regulator
MVSRQEESITKRERSNQKARTRKAILDAAVELLREGRVATVPEAAERAQVSVATAYRYFPSAELLAQEASRQAIEFGADVEETLAAIDAAGDDVHGRVDALARTIGWMMLHDQARFRLGARAGSDTWFAQQQIAPEDRVPVRMGRRTIQIRHALVPLEGKLSDEQMEQLVAAFIIVVGFEAVISLTDVAQLDPEAALEVMINTCRWILDGALAEAGLG